MTAFLTHFSVEFQTGIRNKTLLLMNYLFPLGFYLMMGLIMTQINPLFTDTMVPAMVIFTALVITQLGMPEPLVTAREAGIFRSFKINGVPALSILAIPALSTLLHLSVVSLIIVGTATPFFNAQAPVDWIGFVGVYLAVAIALSGLGLLIGVVSPNSRVTVLFSQLVFLPSMLIGGLMMPFDMLPETIGRIAQTLPATQAMNAFKALAMGMAADFDPIRSVVILLVGGLIAFGLALYLFNWDSKNNGQRKPWLAVLALVPYLIGLL
jgi:ABC-2 type transport system permease protein